MDIKKLKEQQAILNAIQDVGGAIGFQAPSARYSASARIYVNLKDVLLPWGDKTGDTTMLVQCAPKSEHGNYFRVELNPGKADMAMAAALLNPILPSGYEGLVAEGRVTRFDATVDVTHASIDELLVYGAGFKYTSVTMKSGKTIQLGMKGSPTHYVIYDKAAEIKAKNLKKVRPLREPVPKHPLTRIEARLRPQSHMSLTDLPAGPNPFQKLLVIAYGGLPQPDDDFKNVLARCRYEGPGALLAQSKARRKIYLQRLKQGQVDWWDGEKVWAGLQHVVEQIADPLQVEPVATAA